MPILTPISFLIFLTSIVFPMFGQGGGTVYVPLLNLSGLDFHTAVAVSQSMIFVSSLSCFLVYHRAGLVSWRLFLAVELPTLVGAFLGGFVSAWFPEGIAKGLFVGFLFLSAYKMMSGEEAEEREVSPDRSRWMLGMLAMVFAGGVAGLLGIGGGVIKVPLMVLFLGVPVKVAVGTSSLMVGLTALSGLLGHVSGGRFEFSHEVLFYWAVVFLGAQIGARLGCRLNRKHHRRYLGVLLAFVGLAYLLVNLWRYLG